MTHCPKCGFEVGLYHHCVTRVDTGEILRIWTDYEPWPTAGYVFKGPAKLFINGKDLGAVVKDIKFDIL